MKNRLVSGNMKIFYKYFIQALAHHKIKMNLPLTVILVCGDCQQIRPVMSKETRRTK
jgi:hypothetical protein